MNKEDLKKEIEICNSMIASMTELLKDYGTKMSDISKIGLVKEYLKRLGKAQKELTKLEK